MQGDELMEVDDQLGAYALSEDEEVKGKLGEMVEEVWQEEVVEQVRVKMELLFELKDKNVLCA